MLKGHLVLIVVISNIIHGLAVNPCTAEQARPFALLLAHNLAAVDAVVNQVVAGALAVAYLPAGHEELRDILDLLLLRLHLLAVLPALHLLLLVPHLLLILPGGVDALQELCDEFLHVFLSKIEQVAQLLVDGGHIHVHQVVSTKALGKVAPT
jgi:hypothetical protein